MKKFFIFFQKLNNSPVWSHSGLYFLAFVSTSLIAIAALIISFSKYGKVKSGFFTVLAAIFGFLIIGYFLMAIRNYYIDKKIGIWNHYQEKYGTELSINQSSKLEISKTKSVKQKKIPWLDNIAKIISGVGLLWLFLPGFLHSLISDTLLISSKSTSANEITLFEQPIGFFVISLFWLLMSMLGLFLIANGLWQTLSKSQSNQP